MRTTFRSRIDSSAVIIKFVEDIGPGKVKFHRLELEHYSQGVTMSIVDYMTDEDDAHLLSLARQLRNAADHIDEVVAKR
jgi:hypothetical protein